MTAVTEDTGLSGPEKEMKVYNEACIQARKAIKGLIGAAGGDGAPVGINVRKGDVVEAVNGAFETTRQTCWSSAGAGEGLKPLHPGEHGLQDPDFGRCNVYVVH